MGIPYRVVVSPKLVADGRLELKARTSNETRLVAAEDIIEQAQHGTLADLLAAGEAAPAVPTDRPRTGKGES
jgi:hypothetical protein